MRVRRCVFEVGQRFAQRIPDAADRFWVLTECRLPPTMQSPTVFQLKAERGQATMLRTLPALANDLYTGELRCDDEAQSTEDLREPAFNEVVARMTKRQMLKFNMQCAYVTTVLAAENVGASWKDPEFCRLVQTIFEARRTAWEARALATKGTDDEPLEKIEDAPPSKYSVDRWARAVRIANGNLAVLATDALATQTRQPRKPEERKLLQAYIAAKLTPPVKQTAANLHKGIKRLLKKTDPLRFDEEVEKLWAEAREAERENRRRRSKRGTLTKTKTKAQQQPAARGL